MKSQQNHNTWRHFPQRSLCLGTNKIVLSHSSSTSPDYTFKIFIKLHRVGEQFQNVKHQQLSLSWVHLIHIFNNSVPPIHTPSNTWKKGKAGQEKNFFVRFSQATCIYWYLPYCSTRRWFFCDLYIASHLPWQYFYEKGKCCFSFHSNGELIVSESKWLEPLSPELLLCSWMQSSVTFFTG